MKKVWFSTSICIVFLILNASLALGRDFCVYSNGSGESDLQTALATAAGNNEDDTIMVVQGVYDGNFNYSSGETYTLNLVGGYVDGCASREINPAKTVLDANGSGRVLYLGNSVGGDISIDGFTLQNGVIASSGGGLYAYTTGPSGESAGNITIINIIATENSADEFGGGVFAYSYISTGTTGTIMLANNIITENTVDDTNAQGGGGAYVSSGGASGGNTIIITNNTITNNIATGGTSARGGGIFLWQSSNIINLYNNIIWGNSCSDGKDIYINGSGDTEYFYNNDYSDMSGSWNYQGNNTTADPRLTSDNHLRSGSPCIDTGTNSAPSLPNTDFEGDDRTIDGDRDTEEIADMGADEYVPKGVLSFFLLLFD